MAQHTTSSQIATVGFAALALATSTALRARGRTQRPPGPRQDPETLRFFDEAAAARRALGGRA